MPDRTYSGRMPRRARAPGAPATRQIPTIGYLVRSSGIKHLAGTILHEETIKKALPPGRLICAECSWVPLHKQSRRKLIPSESGASYLCVKCYHALEED